METHTDENCINAENITTSNVLSEDEVMNESYKVPESVSFKHHDTVSISESVIVQKNISTVVTATTQPFKSINLQESCLTATLILLMCIIILTLQVPTILYYTDPPSADATLFDNINLESCSVS